MVDALGVSGYEGPFRRSCEITLEFLRNHEDMVMTMLETFLHDPINDWSRKKKVSLDQNSGDVSGFFNIKVATYYTLHLISKTPANFI